MLHVGGGLVFGMLNLGSGLPRMRTDGVDGDWSVMGVWRTGVREFESRH
jgi:hypothetical protein